MEDFQIFGRQSLDWWHLRHWLQLWQLRTWIHDNLCYLTINCDTGQHTQFLRCLCVIFVWDMNIVTLKQVKKLISKLTYKFNTKEWYIIDVSNVVMKHLKSKTFRHRKEQFQCDKCEYKSAFKQSLKLHVVSNHGGKQFTCDGCNYNYIKLHQTFSQIPYHDS